MKRSILVCSLMVALAGAVFAQAPGGGRGGAGRGGPGGGAAPGGGAPGGGGQRGPGGGGAGRGAPAAPATGPIADLVTKLVDGINKGDAAALNGLLADGAVWFDEDGH